MCPVNREEPDYPDRAGTRVAGHEVSALRISTLDKEAGAPQLAGDDHDRHPRRRYADLLGLPADVVDLGQKARTSSLHHCRTKVRHPLSRNDPADCQRSDQYA